MATLATIKTDIQKQEQKRTEKEKEEEEKNQGETPEGSSAIR